MFRVGWTSASWSEPLPGTVCVALAMVDGNGGGKSLVILTLMVGDDEGNVESFALAPTVDRHRTCNHSQNNVTRMPKSNQGNNRMFYCL